MMRNTAAVQQQAQERQDAIDLFLSSPHPVSHKEIMDFLAERFPQTPESTFERDLTRFYKSWWIAFKKNDPEAYMEVITLFKGISPIR